MTEFSNNHSKMRSEQWTILVDLDGTLIDPLNGITGSYKAALTDFGLPVPSDEVLKTFIGPPLRECLSQLLGSNDPRLVEQGVQKYRHYYVNEKFMLRDRVYPGVETALVTLRESGYKLVIATSKAQAYSIDILAHFNLGHHFASIYGSELDGTRANKTELIRFILDKEHLSARQCLMVGDRMHDVKGARENGISCIGVTYGYGSEEELLTAGAAKLCPSMDRLPGIVALVVEGN